MVTCPHCKRPVRSLSAWHYCEEVDIDSLFDNKVEEVTLIAEKIMVALMDWNQVQFSASKNCIIFTRNKTFLILRPMKTQMDLKFYLPQEHVESPIHKVSAWGKKFAHHIRLKRVEDFDQEVINFIKKAYDLC